MSSAARLMTGITLVTVPTIIFGGLTVLGVLTSARGRDARVSSRSRSAMGTGHQAPATSSSTDSASSVTPAVLQHSTATPPCASIRC